MKKQLLILLAVMLVASLTIAAGGKNESKLYGEITGIDADARTMTILVETPLRYAGDSITVQITAATMIKECVDGTSYRISFADLEVGNYVRVTGAFGGLVFVATKIIQYP